MIYMLLKDISNIEEAKQQILDSGLTMCICCNFKNCIGWRTCLYTLDNKDKDRILKSGVHHIHGIYGDVDTTAEQELQWAIAEFEVAGKEVIRCTTVESFITTCKKAWKLN